MIIINAEPPFAKGEKGNAGTFVVITHKIACIKKIEKKEIGGR